MFEHLSSGERQMAIHRLTALWALNECGLGGFLHAIQSPLTGLVVGSLSMICIAFICLLNQNKWTLVMTSLVTVLVIKALVSPHTSPAAYIAVSFQCLTGALIYRYLPGLLFSSILFVSLGLLESAAQRVITLTILYGNTIWEAINIWGAWVASQWGIILPFSSSRLIIIIYFGIHLVAGIGIGLFICRSLAALNEHWGESKYQLNVKSDDKKDFFITRSPKKMKWRRFVIFISLMLLIVLAYALQGDSSGIRKGLLAMLRATVILAIWFIFLAPLFVKLFQKWISKKHKQLSEEISRTMDMFPQLIWIIELAWKETNQMRFWVRWKSFILYILLFALQYKTNHDPHPDRPDTES